VIHVALSDAVHEQPAVPVTAIVPVEPAAVGERDVGATVKLHVTPACVTVTVLPATVNVPLLEAVTELAATEYPTEPFPLPLAPFVTVIHVTLELAVHAQPLGLVTVNVPVDPPDDGESVVGDAVNEHVAPACVTVTDLPATAIVAVLEDALVLADTL
jgi:hypothetical protein